MPHKGANMPKKEVQMDENGEKKFISCDCGKQDWLKFALLLLAVFLGCYLTSYYLLDRAHHKYYTPVRPIHNIDNVLREQDKMFDEMEAIDLSTLLPPNTPVVQTFKKDDTYKIVVDLKPFNGEPSNIKTDITPDRISIYGEKMSKKRNSETDYAFSQSFMLPEKINPKAVTKEKVKGKYIITLPIED